MKNNWFITGVSRGFGKALAQELLSQGCRVFGTTRDGKSDITHPYLSVCKLDVTDEKQAHAALQAAGKWLGTIDVVVNNAGHGMIGAVEEVSDAEARKVFDANVFGTLNVIRAALPILRRQKSGHIVNFSSVGGFTSAAGFGIYCATKFAVEALSEAMLQEVRPLGINVTIVEPGAFRTYFLSGQSIVRAKEVIADYNDTSGKMRQYAEQRHGNQPGDPVAGMKILIRAVNEANPSLRLPLGQDCIDRMKAKIETVAKDIEKWSGAAKEVAFAA